MLAGLFQIVETLFEVRIRRDTRAGLAPERAILPHRARRRSWSASSTSTPTPAPASARGAWMDDVRARWLRPDDGTLQTPVAHLVCNFAPPAWTASRRC